MIFKLLLDHVYCDPSDYKMLHNSALFHSGFFNIGYNPLGLGVKMYQDNIYEIVVTNFSFSTDFTM